MMGGEVYIFSDVESYSIGERMRDGYIHVYGNVQAIGNHFGYVNYNGGIGNGMTGGSIRIHGNATTIASPDSLHSGFIGVWGKTLTIKPSEFNPSDKHTRVLFGEKDILRSLGFRYRCNVRKEENPITYRK